MKWQTPAVHHFVSGEGFEHEDSFVGQWVAAGFACLFHQWNSGVELQDHSGQKTTIISIMPTTIVVKRIGTGPIMTRRRDSSLRQPER